MAVNVRLVGDKELLANIEAKGGRVRNELVTEVTKQTLLLESHIKKDKLSGQVLNVISGRLRASVHSVLPVEQSADTIIGKVAQSGDVKYGGIHEFGGTTPAHIIEPKKAQALHFFMGGKEMFLKRVNHPGSKMPERSYMRSSLADRRDEIVTGLDGAVTRGLA